MFDLFGIRARREARKAKKEKEIKAKEAEELALVQEKKRQYQERKAKIEDWLKVYNKEKCEEASRLNREAAKNAEKKNSTCPKCGSKNVVNKVVRGKGEIHGSGSSSILGSFGGGLLGIGGSLYGSGRSNVDGEFDTYPVNRCKDCEHEWNIEEYEERSARDDFSNYNSVSPGYLYRRVEEYLEMKYNPKDIKEECNSLKEKREKFCKEKSASYLLSPYKKVPRYMIEVALFEGFTEHYYFKDYLDDIFNYHEGDDKYSYRMTDEMWEITKKIIGWEGND